MSHTLVIWLIWLIWSPPMTHLLIFGPNKTSATSPANTHAAPICLHMSNQPWLITDYSPIWLTHYDSFSDMATSSLAREFRKINIEQYDEDFYVDDVIQDNDCSPPDTNNVNTLLSSGKQQVHYMPRGRPRSGLLIGPLRGPYWYW